MNPFKTHPSLRDYLINTYSRFIVYFNVIWYCGDIDARSLAVSFACKFHSHELYDLFVRACR